MISCSQIPMNFPDRCVGQVFPWHYQFRWLIPGCFKGLLKMFFHLYFLYRWIVKVAVEVTHAEHQCGKRKYFGLVCWWKELQTEAETIKEYVLWSTEGMWRCVRHGGREHPPVQGVGDAGLCLLTEWEITRLSCYVPSEAAGFPFTQKTLKQRLKSILIFLSLHGW